MSLLQPPRRPSIACAQPAAAHRRGRVVGADGHRRLVPEPRPWRRGSQLGTREGGVGIDGPAADDRTTPGSDAPLGTLQPPGSPTCRMKLTPTESVRLLRAQVSRCLQSGTIPPR
eukprot:scaffold3166_cov399-Prasinococcus_capsulatus_cf.AAC.14